MKHTVRAAGAAGLALATIAVTAGAASASPAHPSPRGGSVFVQTQALAGNSIVAYHRSPQGTLKPAGTYPTGGLGGQLTGAVVDVTASQGALHQDRGLLFAVNAGSDSITTFRIDGDRLARRQVLPSGGGFPSSITSHGSFVYVLNARDGGSIQGFRRIGDRLVEVPAWHRDLGLDPAATPEFTHTAGQIGFTPDGSKLVVTTKAGSHSILVFDVSRSGAPAAAPVVTTDPGAVPFGFTFDGRGRLVVSEAGPNALATFSVSPSGRLTLIDREVTGQAATCWVVGSGAYLFASNAGSGSLSGFTVDRRGALTGLGNTATDAGTVDAAVTPDGSFLYVQTGAAGNVNQFRVGAGGTLTRLGSVTVPGAVGGEGIVAF